MVFLPPPQVYGAPAVHIDAQLRTELVSDLKILQKRVVHWLVHGVRDGTADLAARGGYERRQKPAGHGVKGGPHEPSYKNSQKCPYRRLRIAPPVENSGNAP